MNHLEQYRTTSRFECPSKHYENKHLLSPDIAVCIQKSMDHFSGLFKLLIFKDHNSLLCQKLYKEVNIFVVVGYLSVPCKMLQYSLFFSILFGLFFKQNWFTRETVFCIFLTLKFNFEKFSLVVVFFLFPYFV